MSKKDAGFIKPSSTKIWGHVQNYDEYLRGELEKQKEQGIIKTQDDLYDSFNCQRDCFYDSLKGWMNIYNKDLKDNNSIKAYTYTLSYHPKDRIENELTPELAHKISMEVCEKYFKDYPTLVVTHIDKEHLHTQVIVGNVNVNTGKSWQCSQTKFDKMRKDFGDKLKENNCTNSLTYLRDKRIKKEDPTEDKEDKKIYYENKNETKKYTPSMAEVQINRRNKATDKEQVRIATLTALKNGASNFNELKNELAKYEIQIEERGQKRYIFIYEDKKGKEQKVRDNNIAKSTGFEDFTREEIEKKMIENAELEKNRFLQMSDEERQREFEMMKTFNSRHEAYLTEERQAEEWNKKLADASQNQVKIEDTNRGIQLAKDEKRVADQQRLIAEKEELIKAQSEIKKQLDQIAKDYQKIENRINEIDKELNQKYPDNQMVKDLKNERRPHLNNREYKRVFGETNATLEMSSTGARERVTESGAEQSNIQKSNRIAAMNNQSAEQEIEKPKNRVVPRI